MGLFLITRLFQTYELRVQQFLFIFASISFCREQAIRVKCSQLLISFSRIPSSVTTFSIEDFPLSQNVANIIFKTTLFSFLTKEISLKQSNCALHQTQPFPLKIKKKDQICCEKFDIQRRCILLLKGHLQGQQERGERGKGTLPAFVESTNARRTRGVFKQTHQD